jgi:hypothetical protein
MLNRTSKKHSPLTLRLASAAIVAALVCGGAWAQTSSGAPAVRFASVNLSDLEAAFWACEYAATTRASANIANCSAIYASLKERKFGGDFDELLKWWRQNRESAFRRLAAVDD